MERQRSVLIPLDGSRLAERSLTVVPPLARTGPLHVSLLSVVDEVEDVRMLSSEEAMQRERNVLQSYLHEIAGDIHKHLGAEVDTEVLEGAPAELILQRSLVVHPDLLIMSTHGRSGLSRWRLGSVADKLIRGVSCPILVIGPKAMEKNEWLEVGAEPAFERILVPLDGSHLGEQALDTAVEYARLFDSEVHFVRVVDVRSYGDGVVMESSYTPRLIDTLLDEARAYLEDVADRTPTPHEPRTEVLTGSPSEALLSYTETAAIGMVVMTSHGRGGVLRAALGSVTDRLLGGVAPVLVVRATSEE